MLRFSRRLPIAKFFVYSSALIAVLAVALGGEDVTTLGGAFVVDGFARFMKIAALIERATLRAPWPE